MCVYFWVPIVFLATVGYKDWRDVKVTLFFRPFFPPAMRDDDGRVRVEGIHHLAEDET